MNFADTKTWREWKSSALSAFGPCEHEAKPLFALLLTATSPTNLENLSRSSFLPDVCKPSVALMRALKKVWRVMQAENERWVIATASLEGLGLGIGLTSFYWKQLTQGKPELWCVRDYPGRRPDQFDHLTKIVKPINLDQDHYREAAYQAEIGFEVDYDFLRQVWVEFYHPVPNEIFVIIGFDVRAFTDNNTVTFQKTMPPNYSLVGFPEGYPHHNDKAICYRIGVTDEELSRVITKSSIIVPHNFRYDAFQPKEGFLDFIKLKLHKIGVPFADTLIVAR